MPPCGARLGAWPHRRCVGLGSINSKLTLISMVTSLLGGCFRKSNEQTASDLAATACHSGGHLRRGLPGAERPPGRSLLGRSSAAGGAGPGATRSRSGRGLPRIRGGQPRMPGGPIHSGPGRRATRGRGAKRRWRSWRRFVRRIIGRQLGQWLGWKLWRSIRRWLQRIIR
jgi:hypothetical protein